MKRVPVLTAVLIFLTAFLLAGCGELEFGVETRLTAGRPDPATVVVTATAEEGIVLVTATPERGTATAAPSQTAASTETATPTPTDTPAPTTTATATAAATATATARPFAPTAPPTSTPLPAEIFSFTATSLTVSPGDDTVVSWSAGGVSAVLCVSAEGVGSQDCFDVSVSGSHNLAIDPGARENIILELRVANPAGQEALATLLLTITCSADYWFFDNPPGDCPSTDPVETFAAAQYFEHGWMLWIEETDRIYAFFEPEHRFGIFYSGFGDPNDPAAENDDFDPPEGYYVPKRGFGLVWRLYSYVRGELGWALEPEFGFDTVYQIDSQGNLFSERLYVQGPDGRIIILDEYLMTWTYR